MDNGSKSNRVVKFAVGILAVKSERRVVGSSPDRGGLTLTLRAMGIGDIPQFCGLILAGS